MSEPSTFTEAKNQFDADHATATVAKCIVPVNGKTCNTASIRDVRGRHSEQYYKWQFSRASTSLTCIDGDGQ